jgi:MFS transporter, DHA2 family, multidrug resistance protein
MSELNDGLAAPRRTWVMCSILMGVVLSSLDSAIANIALPTIARDLGATDAGTVWVVNGYQLATAVCLLPIAALGEIFGHKPIYAMGMALFTAASLGCALSTSLPALVACRLLQGVGGASMSGLGAALVRDIYPRRLLGGGFALIALAVAMSGAAGPTIAALILSIARWPWLFLVNLPVCLAALPLFLSLAPPSSRHRRAFDVSGAVLSAVSLGLLVVGVDTLGSGATQRAVIEIVAGLVGMAVLVWQQSRRAAPLLPVDLMRIPLFGLSVATSVCSYSAQILSYVSLPFLFQIVMHRSQIATGLLVTPWPLLVAFAAPVAGRLTGKYPASILGSLGLAVLTLGLVLLVFLPAAPADWNIAWRMGVCGIGFGFFQTPNNTTLMTTGPANRTGAASGMVAVARTLGWSLGSALVALIFGLGGAQAALVCLKVAAGFAGVGALISLSRFRAAGTRDA